MSGLTDEDCEALVEAIRTGWHGGGMYGRADFDPRWLDGLASVTAADVAGAVEQIVARHVAAALNEAADEAEFRFRSMTFSCGKGESTTRLHPVGDWLRARTT